MRGTGVSGMQSCGETCVDAQNTIIHHVTAFVCYVLTNLMCKMTQSDNNEGKG